MSEKAPLRTVRPSKCDIPPEELCKHCNGKCCRYIALPIDKPTNYEEFDFIRWYLYHEKVAVFVEEGAWHLLVMTPCKALGSDNRCTVYQTRPQICREYSTAKCEYEDLYLFEQYFETPEQVEDYARALLGPRPNASFRTESLDDPPIQD
ncbi:MAG: YkgJ family cysteine cluster protein [Planctomycetia bacterium]|nr:YkgJ family cysteine cluster protein [Planctomycetia bacterium]